MKSAKTTQYNTSGQQKDTLADFSVHQVSFSFTVSLSQYHPVVCKFASAHLLKFGQQI